MKKSTVLKVIGVLALMDLTDIAAKGCTIAYARGISPEVGESWKDRNFTFKPIELRCRMIDKFADLFDELM